MVKQKIVQCAATEKQNIFKPFITAKRAQGILEFILINASKSTTVNNNADIAIQGIFYVNDVIMT